MGPPHSRNEAQTAAPHGGPSACTMGGSPVPFPHTWPPTGCHRGTKHRGKKTASTSSSHNGSFSLWHKGVTTGRDQHHSRRFLQLPPPSRCATGSTKPSPSSHTTGSTGTILAPQHFLQHLHQEAKPAKSSYHIPPPHQPHVSYLKQKPATCSTTTSQAQVLALQNSSWCSATQINSRWGCPSPLHLGHQVSCISLVVSKLVRKTKWSRSTGVVCDHKTVSLTWSGKQAAKMSLK